MAARRYRVGVVVAVVAVIALSLLAALLLGATGTGGGCPATGCPPITQWRARAGFRPLSDADAKARVRTAAENRPGNAKANAYKPSAQELKRFYASRDSNGETPEQRNPYLGHVTGQFSGTTDEIIQWTAHKWGIPEDWLRAQYAVESHWRQNSVGDRRTESPAARARYPGFSCPTDRDCYESLGLAQVKWRADGSDGAGTEPLRWKSTAFNVDYAAATVRFYYDDPGDVRSSWGDPGYRPEERWLSIAGWFAPYPWGNSHQRQYLRRVKRALAERVWERADF